jgi:hypothetical protein
MIAIQIAMNINFNIFVVVGIGLLSSFGSFVSLICFSLFPTFILVIVCWRSYRILNNVLTIFFIYIDFVIINFRKPQLFIIFEMIL